MVAKLAPYAPRTVGTLCEVLEARRAVVARCLDDLRAEIAEAFDQRDISDLFDDDEPVVDTDAERCLMLAERADLTLHGIEDALARVAAGSYGYCVDCGERIPLDRLRGLPATPACIGCSRRRGSHWAAAIDRVDPLDAAPWHGFDPSPYEPDSPTSPA